MAKPILITGGSSGIGKAATESLSAAGCMVYPTVRTEEDFSSLVKLPRVHPLMMDVTDREEVKRGIAQIVQAGEGLYGVVNNAAVIDVWPLVELEDDELRRSLEVNLLGVHRVVRESASLLARAHGRIVNVSSLEGLVSTKLAGPYEASKFALEAYSDNLRRELRPYGVTVAIVEPGGFSTNYAKSTAKVLERRARVMKPALMKKEAEEVAATWKDEVSDVEGRAQPSLVAEVIMEALLTEEPRNRYVVTSNMAEFRWAMGKLASRLVEVNRGSTYALSRGELATLVDEAWTKESRSRSVLPSTRP
ncbi:MAG: SDR family NAD(P)-dependent oxidoreductase [Nitrososphaerota archaeon]|nr:SDR family NAD(P)-dependent oxidoreductase [Nitrososphaerota archaeon]MDG7004332.1 SDR family NAD(P)-dependent oxidoreductase [Nitrososphaerota archaeon]MDG7031095.1 SDR family NAD(P)-dependent oxidoreductase [Nitrososphaerota archaeon]